MKRSTADDSDGFSLHVPKKTGFGGTTWRDIGNLAYLTNCAVVIIACAVVISGVVMFRYVLVPTSMAYFLTFLFDPLVNLLHQRPLMLKRKPGL